MGGDSFLAHEKVAKDMITPCLGLEKKLVYIVGSSISSPSKKTAVFYQNNYLEFGGQFQLC